MRWLDYRLKGRLLSNMSGTFGMDNGERYAIFNRDPVKDIWFPDIYVDKAKDLRVPVYQIPPSYLRIYNSGMLSYSARVNYDVSCPMSFEEYPVSKEMCETKNTLLICFQFH